MARKLWGSRLDLENNERVYYCAECSPIHTLEDTDWWTDGYGNDVVPVYYRADGGHPECVKCASEDWFHVGRR